MDKKFRLTVHVKERFLERTNKRYKHLMECRTDACALCHNFQYEIWEKTKDPSLNEVIMTRLREAEENRSFVNNFSFMERYYSKYGFDKRFCFLVSNDIVFVCVADDNHGWVVVTCICAAGHLAGKAEARPRFNRIKSQRTDGLSTQK